MLLVVGGGLVALQKTGHLSKNVTVQLNPDLSAVTAMRVYSNEKLGVRFAYPSDWIVTSMDESTITVTSPQTAKAAADFLASGAQSEFGPSYDIAITHLPSLSAYAAEFGVTEPCTSIPDCLQAGAEIHGAPEEVRTLTVGGKTAYTYLLPSLGLTDYVALEHNGVYEILFTDFMAQINTAGEAVLVPQAQKILDSLQFTN